MRTLGDYADDSAQFPRYGMQELRPCRYMWYKTRLAARMKCVRIWWLLKGIWSLVVLIDFISKTINPLEGVFLNSVWYSILGSESYVLPAYYGNVVLYAAYVLLGTIAGFSVLSCSARDYHARDLTQDQAGWLWPDQQEGVTPCQTLPPRILAPHPSAADTTTSKSTQKALWDEFLSSAAPATLKNFRRPLRIVILSIGTRGDVQPYVALGCALKEAGHSVVISTTRNFRGFVEEYGLEFGDTGLPCIEQPENWLTITSVAQMIKGTSQKMIRDYPVMAKAFTEAALQPIRADVIIGTAMTVTFALNLSEATGIPAWVAKLAPDILTRGYVLPGSLPSRCGWWNYIRCWAYWLNVALAVESTSIGRAEGDFRQSLGLPRNPGTKRIKDMLHIPQLLGFSKHLFPKPADYPDWAFQCGFWLGNTETARLQENPAGVSAKLRAFLREAERGTVDPATGEFVPIPVSVVTFGSMTNASRDTLVADIVDCLLEARTRVVVVTGWAKPPAGVPLHDTRVCLVSEAPHDWLFHRAALVVHHGGAGTTSRALACGVPSIVLPVLRWADQMQWGELAEQRGVGVLIRERDPPKEIIAAAIQRVLQDNQQKTTFTGSVIGDTANKAGAVVRAERSAQLAQRLLETCICNIVLSPKDADAIHPRSKNPGKSLTTAQEMCRTHCIACHRLRQLDSGNDATAANAASALLTKLAASASAASASDPGPVAAESAHEESAEPELRQRNRKRSSSVSK